MKIKNNSILAVDMDGVLSEGDSFTDEECLKAKPIQKIIDKVNKLNRQGVFIIIHSSRKEWLREATTYWLNVHKVRYNAIVLGKLWSNYYLDDRNLLIKDL